LSFHENASGGLPIQKFQMNRFNICTLRGSLYTIYRIYARSSAHVLNEFLKYMEGDFEGFGTDFINQSDVYQNLL